MKLQELYFDLNITNSVKKNSDEISVHRNLCLLNLLKKLFYSIVLRKISIIIKCIILSSLQLIMLTTVIQITIMNICFIVKKSIVNSLEIKVKISLIIVTATVRFAFSFFYDSILRWSNNISHVWISARRCICSSKPRQNHRQCNNYNQDNRDNDYTCLGDILSWQSSIV